MNQCDGAGDIAKVYDTWLAWSQHNRTEQVDGIQFHGFHASFAIFLLATGTVYSTPRSLIRNTFLKS